MRPSNPQQNKNNDEMWAWTTIDAKVRRISVKQSLPKIYNKDRRGRKTPTLKSIRESKTCTYKEILKISPVEKNAK